MCTTDEHPMWEFNARFCKECRNAKLVKTNDPLSEVLAADRIHLKAHIPSRAVFTSHCDSYGRQFYLRSEIEEVLDKSDKLLQLDDDDALALFVGNILSRLRELGWGAELDYLRLYNYAPIRRHELCDVAQKLTERVWRTTGKDLITCMEKAREDRLAYEYLQKLRNRWTSLEVTLTTLLDRPEARAYDVGIGDIAFMPEIREVVDAPDDEFMDESSFAEVHENFGEMVERWKVNATKQLRELVMQSRPRPQGSRKAKAKCAEVDVLKLATTRFHCIICDDRSAALYYPGVLSHSCLRCNCRPKEDDPYKRFVYGKLKEVGGSIAILRHLDRLEVAEVSDAATSVIQLCGKDPKVATVKKMNALGIMLVQGGIIRTWRNAILVDDIHDTMSEWRLATPDEVALVKTRLPNIKERRSRYYCAPCRSVSRWQLTYSHKEALGHLRWVHGIDSPSLDHEFLKGSLPPDDLLAAGSIRVILTGKD
ncbi:hypothetical protein FOMPIDRAFT_1062502 [Fomitopsis schrenkii]|uniref:Uncharacterized protein n=1 Tax=Fomitopsis schrenkii TaxID=2126942 RepID=S8DXM3_FOMSC|nr:hypothetical protein FOMPIDRAFT_1062502 [Fomitopsis schrenkii]